MRPNLCCIHTRKVLNWDAKSFSWKNVKYNCCTTTTFLNFVISSSALEPRIKRERPLRIPNILFTYISQYWGLLIFWRYHRVSRHKCSSSLPPFFRRQQQLQRQQQHGKISKFHSAGEGSSWFEKKVEKLNKNWTLVAHLPNNNSPKDVFKNN